MQTLPEHYAARLAIDYPEQLDRVTTFLRLIWVVPIAMILGLLTSSGSREAAPFFGVTVTVTAPSRPRHARWRRTRTDLRVRRTDLFET